MIKKYFCQNIEDNFKRLIYSNNTSQIYKNLDINIKNKNEQKLVIKNNLVLLNLLYKMKNYNYKNCKYHRWIFDNTQILSKKESFDFDISHFLYYLEFTNSIKISGKNISILNVIKEVSKNNQNFIKYSLQLVSDKVFDAINSENKLKIIYFYSIMFQQNLFPQNSENNMEIRFIKTIFDKQVDKVLNFHIILEPKLEYHLVFLKAIHNLIKVEPNKLNWFFIYLDLLSSLIKNEKLVQNDKQISISLIKESFKIFETISKSGNKDKKNLNNFIGKYIEFKKNIKDYFLKNSSYNEFIVDLLYVNKIDYKIEKNLKDNFNDCIYISSHSVIPVIISQLFKNTEKDIHINIKLFSIYHIINNSTKTEEIVKNNLYNIMTIFKENYNEFKGYVKIKEKSKFQLLNILENIIKYKREQEYYEKIYEVRIIGIKNNII